MNDKFGLIIAFYYFGLLIFSLLGLVWLGHQRAVKQHDYNVRRLLIFAVRTRSKRR